MVVLLRRRRRLVKVHLVHLSSHLRRTLVSACFLNAQLFGDRFFFQSTRTRVLLNVRQRATRCVKKSRIESNALLHS